MRTYIATIVAMLALVLVPYLSTSSNQSDLPDLAIQREMKNRSEVISEDGKSWKILVRGKPPLRNVSVVIEALEGISVNPSLHSSGHVDFSSFKSIVNDVVFLGMTEEQKALALWRFAMDNAYPGAWGTSFDGLEHLNVYGYGYCGTFVAVLEPLWWAAGLKARHVNIGGHAATEVYYDNNWHYIDAHRRCFFLTRDNRTIASLDDLNNDPELWDMKRGMGSSKRGQKKNYYMSMHPQGQGNSPAYSRSFTMAKGDALTLRWNKNGKWCLARGAEGGGEPAPAPDIYANGTFRFHRDLSDPAQNRVGLVSSKNVDWQDLSAGYLHPLKTREEAYLIYQVKVPYFIAEATISATLLRRLSNDSVGIDISTDNGKSWITLWGAQELGIVKAHLSTTKTQEITTDKLWKYSYLIRVRMRAEGSPRDAGGYLIESLSDLFYNPKSLPALQLGENKLTYHDAGSSARSIKVTYRWEEDLPISVSKESPLEGEEVLLSARVANRGTRGARKVPVAFYLGGAPGSGGVEIGRDSIDAIAAGETVYAKVKWKATRSTARGNDSGDGSVIYAKVDPDNAIRESDKTNNISFRVIKVLNPPEVSVPSESFIKFGRRKDAKDIITITATVRNFSNSTNYGHYLSDHADAIGVKVRFFDGEPKRGGKQIGSDQIITRLAPLEFKNVSVDWNISQLQGRRRILVQLQSPQNVIEAGGPKGTQEIWTKVDLDAYRSCRR